MIAGSNSEAAPELPHAPEAEPAAAHMHWLMTAHHGIQILSPDTYFAGGQPILREKVRAWEHKLKALLFCWASKHESYGLEATAAVLDHLKAASAWAADTAATDKIQPEEFHSMLRGLEQKSMLPMLTFSFDRRGCERLASKQLFCLAGQSHDNDTHIGHNVQCSLVDIRMMYDSHSVSFIQAVLVSINPGACLWHTSLHKWMMSHHGSLDVFNCAMYAVCKLSCKGNRPPV